MSRGRFGAETIMKMMRRAAIIAVHWTILSETHLTSSRRINGRSCAESC